MTYLLTLLFFAAVLGVATAAIWSTLSDSWDLVRANMPWQAQDKGTPARPVLLGDPLDQFGHA